MKKRKTKNNSGNMFQALLFVFLLALSVYSISTNVIKYWGYKTEKSQLVKQLKSLKEEEVILKKNMAQMQSPDYIAKYAREKYFYSKPNEIIIKLD